MQLGELLQRAMPHFEYYGITLVKPKDWEWLRDFSKEAGGIWEEVILELSPWVEACFKEEKVFTICRL